MSATSFIGWVMIVAALACFYCMKNGARRENKISKPDEKEGINLNNEYGEWCNAFELINNARVFLFDGALRLMALGSNSSNKKIMSGTHIIDVFSGAKAHRFVAGAAQAKRDGASSWAYNDEDISMKAKAVKIFEDHIIIVVEENCGI